MTVGSPTGTQPSHRTVQILAGALNVVAVMGFVYQLTVTPQRQLLAGTLVLIGLLAAVSFWLSKPVRGVITFSIAGLIVAMGAVIYLRVVPVDVLPPIPPAPAEARIIGPLDQFRVSETRLPVTISAPEPADGHQWYVTVQPTGWSKMYFESVIRSAPGIYWARAGVGPPGPKGIGAYALSLVEVDSGAAEAIVTYKRTYETLYNDMGMTPPPGVRVVHTITVQR